MDEHSIGGGGHFTFSGVRVESLGATEYTLATVAIDITGSTSGFASELRAALIAAIKACKKSPRSDNLLVRVILFSDALQGGIEEVHGFKPVSEINPDEYKEFQPSGLTPLCDATYSAVGATLVYGKQLADNSFGVNAIVFIITDGGDNASVSTTKMIKEQMVMAIVDEQIESLVTVLIGINTAQCSQLLAEFWQQTGITQYIDAGDVTPGKLAKLAAFVSNSVSSQSQALGSGGPSKNIAATF